MCETHAALHTLVCPPLPGPPAPPPRRHTTHSRESFAGVPWRGAAPMAALARFTTIPRECNLHGILDWFHEDPATLIVWNHPLWDETRRGAERFHSVANRFLRRYHPWIHALEVDGPRPWKENRQVMRWAVAEFVDEAREDHRSRVLVMPQYRHSLASDSATDFCG